MINGWCGRTSCATADPTPGRCIWCWSSWPTSQGLSYYSDATLSRLLKLEPLALNRARQQLIAAELVAYHKPLYQVLALPPAIPAAPTQRSGQTLSVGDILRRVVEGGGA